MRSPPERGGAGGADTHGFEPLPFGVAVQIEEVAADRDLLGAEVGGLVAAPAPVDASIGVEVPVEFILGLLVSPGKEDGRQGHGDFVNDTKCVYRSFWPPLLWL